MKTENVHAQVITHKHEGLTFAPIYGMRTSKMYNYRNKKSLIAPLRHKMLLKHVLTSKIK
jgi:hypothetical protein